MGRVVIGTDPHKRSATIEVRDEREILLATGRFGVDRTGYRLLLGYVRQWPARVWAVEGATGVGRPLAARLLADGETVWDVPAKLAARVRVFDTGHGRETDATDAHSIVMVALRIRGLRQLTADEDLVVLRLLADRRDEVSHARNRTLNRLHRLLAELIPAGAPRHLSALQAKALLAGVRPRDPAGRTRRALAAELLAELESLDGKLKALKRRLGEAVTATGSGLMDIYGVGPAGAARILADVADVARFADRNRFASRPAPPRSTPPPANRSATDSPAPGTGGLTTCSTSPPSSRSATTPPAGPTTGASFPRARHRWKPCAACADDCPKWSTGSWSPTPTEPTRPSGTRRAREGNGGRLLNPARPAQPPQPDLRTSHSPDPHPRRYPPARPVLSPHRPRQLPHRADAPEASTWSAPPDERR